MLSSYRVDHAAFGKKGNTPACLPVRASDWPAVGAVTDLGGSTTDVCGSAVLAFGLGPSTRQWPFPRRYF